MVIVAVAVLLAALALCASSVALAADMLRPNRRPPACPVCSANAVHDREHALLASEEELLVLDRSVS